MRRINKHVLLCLILSGWMPGFAKENSAAIQMLTEKLNQPVHPQFAALNFDLLDLPIAPGGPLALEDARQPGVLVDVDQELAGEVVVLLDIDTKERHKIWSSADENSPAVKDWNRIMEEYEPKGVVFLAVWAQQRNQSVEQQRAEALAYAAKNGLTGYLLLDKLTPKTKVPQGSRRSLFTTYASSRLPGHPPGNQVLIRNAEGSLVFKARESRLGFGYHTVRHLLDRLLDPAYDTAVRSEFPGKSRALPVVKKKSGGLLYSESFDHYADNHTFKLEPRWGFTYAKQSRLDIRPDLVEGQGREGSSAIDLHHHYSCLSLIPYGLQHQLPAPLTDGTLSFYLKRGKGKALPKPSTGYRAAPGATAYRSLCIGFGQPESYEPAGHIFATGDWMNETFVPSYRIDQPGAVAYARNAWQKVTVTCKPGRNAAIRIDGQPVGELNSESIDWFGVRLSNEGKTCLLDDVEIFYKGDPDALQKAHAAASKKSISPVTPFTAEQTALLTAAREPRLKGSAAATLPAGAVSRPDIGYWEPPYLTFDHPIPARPLVLENLLNPGQFEDLVEKHRGKIIWVTRLRKGDHGNEQAIRPRTALRSPTVFNRVYKLAKEYGPKGVVVIGVGAVDGGHRDMATTYEDRVMDTMETIIASRDLQAELGIPKEHIIYGSFPEVYDEIVGERFPGQLRLWNETIRGNLLGGQFAGMGTDTIIDPQGRIVYRGTGPDGNQYWKARYVLDRLLDPTFELACRQEFSNPELKHHKSPLLPNANITAKGVTYRDGFENYIDTYDFGLQPCWGFTYENYPNEHTAALFEGKGRDGSKAILLNNYQEADKFCGNKAGTIGARHKLPAPLTDGHVRFYVKRGEHVKAAYYGQPPLYRFGVCFYDGEGAALESITTLGEWQNEHFAIVKTEPFKKWNAYKRNIMKGDAIVKKTEQKMARDDWQEIRITCKPEANATVSINGIPAGELSGGTVGAVEFRQETWSGTWVDDFEVFYRGDGDALHKQHKEGAGL